MLAYEVLFMEQRKRYLKCHWKTTHIEEFQKGTLNLSLQTEEGGYRFLQHVPKETDGTPLPTPVLIV